jgi:putative phosphoribosyl transferase
MKMEKLIHISDQGMEMEGMLKVPAEALGLVIFVHGSGSSRFSPRNNFVANVLHDKGNLGTLLIDLLTKKEDEIHQTRFDIGLLTHRLEMILQWLSKQEETKKLAIGLFGASTGAAAALNAAASQTAKIKAVVSRGGRPDLALAALGRVVAPTLFIVGGNDFGVIELNQQAYALLNGEKQFIVIPHATHLFEEPGCLEEVASVANQWFIKHLTLPVTG